LTDAELQSLVDGAWARRDRWRAFEPLSRLADAHDADAGALPRLLQRYVDQDSLQPYADQSSRDPRLWAQLGLAADHVDFIRFIRLYAAAHPSTRATTELLFLLDRLAEASRDALSVLRGSDPSEQLGWTHASYPQAYRLLTQIRAYVENALVRLDLRTEDAITAHYERTRLGILEAIVRTTPEGYRASDARFLIGEVYWRQQRVDEAIGCWSAMVVASGDSRAVPAGNLLRALRAYPPALSKTGTSLVSAQLRREIDQILKNEHGRWVMFSYDRLRQFGFRFDTY
jgi:tetratricopeptide (TPR) repeat protein